MARYHDTGEDSGADMGAAESLAFVQERHNNANPSDGQIAALKLYLESSTQE